MATTTPAAQTKRFMRGAGLLALLGGLLGAINLTTPGAHATRMHTFNPICYVCGPSIAITSVDPSTDLYQVSGALFTPGGAVQLTLLGLDPTPTVVLGVTPVTQETMGQADTTASLALTFYIGGGRYFHTTGGLVTATIDASNAGWQCPPDVEVIATDEATGLQASETVPFYSLTSQC